MSASGCCSLTVCFSWGAVISHETGNYNTFPRVTQLIKAFKESGSTIRPYWLSPSFDKLNATGLLDEEEAWAVASEQL